MTLMFQVETEPMDDQEIIDGLLQGSARAADVLVDRYAQPLIRYFSVHLPDPTQAEDMTQEVFLRLITMLQRQRGTVVRSLYSLLFTIARHLAIDVSKAAKRRPKIASLDAELEQETAGPILVRLQDTAP